MYCYDNGTIQKLAKILDHIQRELSDGVAFLDTDWERHWHIFTWQKYDLNGHLQMEFNRHYSFAEFEKTLNPLGISHSFIEQCKANSTYQEFHRLGMTGSQ